MSLKTIRNLSVANGMKCVCVFLSSCLHEKRVHRGKYGALDVLKYFENNESNE